MIPDRRIIANQICKASLIHPDWSVSEIATQLGYSTVFIIDALNYAEDMKFISRNLKKDTLLVKSAFKKLSSPDFGEDIFALRMAIFRTLNAENLKEQDIEEGLMWQWSNGVRPIFIEIAIDALIGFDAIVKYDLTDPKDDKSVYTFLTLPDHVEHQWGKKQFKSFETSEES